MALRTISGTSQSSYTLPLSTKSITQGKDLWLLLEDHSIDIDDDTAVLFHDFVYSIIGVPASNSDMKRWTCPLQCFLAVSSYQENGAFIKDHRYTPILAMWEYNLRQLHFMEAYFISKTRDITLLRYAFSILVLMILILI